VNYYTCVCCLFIGNVSTLMGSNAGKCMVIIVVSWKTKSYPQQQKKHKLLDGIGPKSEENYMLFKTLVNGIHC